MTAPEVIATGLPLAVAVLVVLVIELVSYTRKKNR